MQEQTSVPTEAGQSSKGIPVMEFTADVTEVVNYAFFQNGLPFVRDLVIRNCSGRGLTNVSLTIHGEDCIVPFSRTFGFIHPGEEIRLHPPGVALKGDVLASLSERREILLELKLWEEDVEIAFLHKNICILAFDEWQGDSYFPELLASFVQPAAPYVKNLVQKAAARLLTQEGEGILPGYETTDTNQIRRMAEAIFEVIREEGIARSDEPEDYGVIGQRVRMEEDALQGEKANTLDLSILYASCLEAVGLNPLLILEKGEAFTGLWLVKESFKDVLVDDPEVLRKSVADNLQDVMVMHSRVLTESGTFSDAVLSAGKKLLEEEGFSFALDVTTARKSGIQPLPLRIHTEDGIRLVLPSQMPEEEVDFSPVAVLTNRVL